MRNKMRLLGYNKITKKPGGLKVKIKKMIDDFLLEVKLRFSLGNWKFYSSHLKHFEKFLYNIGIDEVDQVSKTVLVDYISLSKETCANITINHRIGCLKRMYRSKGIKFDYLQSIDKFKVRRKTFNMLSMDELKLIRQHVKCLDVNVGNNMMYQAVCLLLMDTGARIKEILMIEKKCVDLTACEILLTHTKTKEDRLVYISQVTSDALRMLLDKTKNVGHRYLLHNFIGNRQASYDDVIYFMKKLKKKLSIEKLHPHMFRHSMATILLERGTDIKSVMQILGHRNLETTQRYLHANHEHVKQMYMKNFMLDD